MRTRCVAAIILATVVFALPSLINQSFATSGNHVEQVQTLTVGTTLMATQSQRQQIFGGPFKVPSTTGTNFRCQLYNFTFIANQGQYVAGNFTSIVPLDFYIVPDPIYRNWIKSGSCGDAGDAISSQMGTTGYGFNVTFTSTGPWDIVLVNSSNSRDADGFLVAFLSATSYIITEPLLATTTLASVTSASLPTGIPGFPVESILLGALVGVVLLSVLRHKKRTR